MKLALSCLLWVLLPFALREKNCVLGPWLRVRCRGSRGTSMAGETWIMVTVGHCKLVYDNKCFLLPVLGCDV